MRAVMYGTVEGSSGSWYEAVVATPFSEGANLEPLSPFHALLSESAPGGAEAPQSRRIWWLGTVELLPAAMASDKRHSSVRLLMITREVWGTIVMARVS
jgi:hypothetical protein